MPLLVDGESACALPYYVKFSGRGLCLSFINILSAHSILAAISRMWGSSNGFKGFLPLFMCPVIGTLLFQVSLASAVLTLLKNLLEMQELSDF